MLHNPTRASCLLQVAAEAEEKGEAENGGTAAEGDGDGEGTTAMTMTHFGLRVRPIPTTLLRCGGFADACIGLWQPRTDDGATLVAAQVPTHTAAS